MNKLQFQRELINALKAATDPKTMKEMGEELVKAEALVADKQAEVQAALKIIQTSKNKLDDIKEEQGKLDYLKNLKVTLEKTEQALKDKEDNLKALGEAHDSRKSKLSQDQEALNVRAKMVDSKELAVTAREQAALNKETDLATRELAIQEREELHKSFIKKFA